MVIKEIDKSIEEITRALNDGRVFIVAEVTGRTTLSQLIHADTIYREVIEEEFQTEVVPDTEEEAEEQPKDGPLLPPLVKHEEKEKKVDTGKLVALWNAGWTPKMIAEEFGCATPSLYHHFKKLGIDYKTRGVGNK